MDVFFCRISVSMLSWFGSRCCTKINAIQEVSGIAFSSRLNASNPPADAPTPTTGKPSDTEYPDLCFSLDLAMTPAGFLESYALYGNLSRGTSSFRIRGCQELSASPCVWLMEPRIPVSPEPVVGGDHAAQGLGANYTQR